MLEKSRFTKLLGLLGAVVLVGCPGGDDDDRTIPPLGVAISAFTASPMSVSAGGTTTLGWTVSKADSITITANPGGQVTMSSEATGSVESSPITENTTFTLAATGGGQTVMRTVNVTVMAGGVPTINSFTANPMGASTGTPITLRWTTANATQVRVTEGTNELLNSTTMTDAGTFQATMGIADTTFTLQATNAEGMVSETVTVTLLLPTGETEPNNDSTTANDANVGGGVDGALADGADEDWYSFTVTEGGNVFAETSDGMGGCDSATTADTILTLFDTDGMTELAGNDEGVTPPCSTIDPRFDSGAAELAAGTYFIRVTGFLGDVGPYRLTVVVGEGPSCGNQILEAGSGETCDDGNASNGDGCSSTCMGEISGAGTFNLNVDLTPPNNAVFLPIEITTAGQSITATTTDGAGDCPFATVMQLGDADLNSLGAVVRGNGGCAAIDPTIQTYAGNLDVGNYVLLVAEEVADTGGPLTVEITVADASCGNGINETLGNEQCDDGNTAPGDGCSATCTVEPLGTVTGLDQDMTFSEAITPAGQQDHFEVVLPMDGYIIAETGAPTIGVCDSDDTVVRLYDDQFTIVDSNDDGGVGACSLLRSDLLTAGTYYVRVEEFGNNAEIAAYQIQIQTAGPGCGNQIMEMGEQCDDGNTTPGDGCDASCMIEAVGTVSGLNQDQTFSGALTPAGTQLFYSVILPSDGYIVAETGAPTIGVCDTDDTVLTIFDAQFTEVGRNDEGGPGSCSLYDGLASSSLLTAGTYFVRVEEFLNDDEIAAFELRIQTAGTGCGNGAVEPGEQCDDGNNTPGDGCDAGCNFEGNIVVESEPNDDIASANTSGAAIGMTVTVSGSIGPMVGDVDYYAFTIANTASVQAITYTQLGDNTVCAPGNDTRVYLLDSAMVELAENDDANGLCSNLDPTMDAGAANLPAGTYYLRVQHFDNSNTFGPYLMDIILQ